jgi:predicted amino acid dehydrogenase
VARAVRVAAGLGARCVSLAGLIPASTAYGFDVLRDLGRIDCRVTTGHATTAASVVRTTLAALAAARRDLSEVTLACVGLGSIGRSSLELLLALEAGAPRALVLCDVPERSRSLAELAGELTTKGCAGEIITCTSDPSVPATVLDADVVVAATSSPLAVLDVDRLRPGTVVVDDSFPHCFDVEAAARRMQHEKDVLVIGGGLLHCSPSTSAPAVDLPHIGHPARLHNLRLPDTVASCQLESLLQASRPQLPLVHGLVDVPLALSYWEAMGDAGVSAAPLHLAEHVIDVDDLPGLRPC